MRIVVFLTVVGLAAAQPAGIASAQPTQPPRAEGAASDADAAEETTPVAAEPEAIVPAADPLAEEGDSSAVPASAPRVIVLRNYLVLPRVGEYGRRPLHRDPIDAAMASGEWTAPEPGDEVTAADGRQVAWRIAVADAGGRLSGPATGGGYAWATVTLKQPRVMLLEATHHAAVCVNGEWLAGDPYGAGPPSLPIALKKGENSLLFQVALPGFRARLVEVEPRVVLEPADATVPDLVAGGPTKQWAATTVRNATAERIVGAELRVRFGEELTTIRLPALEPMTVLKAPFRFSMGDDAEAAEKLRIDLHLLEPESAVVSPDASSSIELPLRRVPPDQPRVCTFPSRIDASVQAYSVVPAASPAGDDKAGLILALHGAGVDHADFASEFRAKDWAHIVVPQNRRPYGFDWEDWGATDAMEALADARKRLPHDARRTCVMGHGVGGRGALRLAMRYPDRFAAVGSIAGKIVFGSPKPATGAKPDEPTTAAAVLNTAAAQREPAALLRNLSTVGVYLLHGEVDRRVPPAQSRFLRGRLGEFHPDFVYYEHPGAGHRWGPDGVDWPAMSGFFRTRRLPEPGGVRRVDFTTAHPTDASTCHWVTVEAHTSPLRGARVVLEHDRDGRSFTGRTENVDALSIDVSHLAPKGAISVRLDGNQTVKAKWPGRAARLWLDRDEEGRWTLGRAPLKTAKTVRRAGLLKSVFDNRPLLLYGTRGDPEENRWAQAKARHDAQSFWRRGNGFLEVRPDTAFNPAAEPNRNIVLYGNAETNAAWPALLSTSPVQLRGDRVEVGVESSVRTEKGEDLALLMIRPRPGSATASVAVVGGAGIAGMRATNRLRYFVSGVAYPDLLMFGSGALSTGDNEVRAAGYFGADWQVGSGRVVWRDLAL